MIIIEGLEEYNKVGEGFCRALYYLLWAEISTLFL